MQIGIRLHDAGGKTFEERAETARQQGFSCVHLALSKVLGPDYMRPGALTPGLMSWVKKTLQPLDIAVLGCYLNLAHPDPGALRAIQQTYIAHLRAASWLPAAVVGTETGNPNPQIRYEPERSHSDETLQLFIQGLEPVVAAAEKLGAILAIEPVYTNIVYDGPRARKVLDHFKSPNLQIILDPVNLLHKDNLHRAQAVIQEAVDLLLDDIAVLHLKDFVVDGERLKALSPGLGVMDYQPLLRALVPHKPLLYATLENTQPENAVAARQLIESSLKDCGARLG